MEKYIEMYLDSIGGNSLLLINEASEIFPIILKHIFVYSLKGIIVVAIYAMFLSMSSHRVQVCTLDYSLHFSCKR